MAARSRVEKALRLIASLGNRDRMTSGAFLSMLRSLRNHVSSCVASSRPDIIHCHDVYASSAVISIATDNSIPILQTVHGPALYEAQMGGVDKQPCLREIIIQCERDAFQGVGHYICVDSGQAQILKDDYYVPNDRISVIFNCIDVDEVRCLANGHLPVPVCRPFFLVPRRLVVKNGVRYAIEAMLHVHDPAIELIVAGNGPLRVELERFASKLGLSDRIRFIGGIPRDQLMPLIARAKGVIIPSVPTNGVIEATSLAVTESMAIGTVPIASRIGGLVELIDNENTGLLISPADPKELARAMDSVISDDNYRKCLVKAAKAKAERDYSVHPWLTKIISIYNAMLRDEVAS